MPYQFALSDVATNRNQGIRSPGLIVLGDNAEIAAIKCIPKHSGESVSLSLHDRQNAGELRGKDHQPLVGYTFVNDFLDAVFCSDNLITDFRNDTFTAAKGGSYTMGFPSFIDMAEQLPDAIDGSTLTCLRRVPDLQDEQVGAVPSPFDLIVRTAPYGIPEGRQEVK